MATWIPAGTVGRLGAAEAWIEARNPGLTPKQVTQRAGWILLGWLNPERLDQLTREITAFEDFKDMVENTYPSYSPTLLGARARELADGYDAAQAARGDPRRAWRGDLLTSRRYRAHNPR
jgi:hypothetical protein